MAADLINKPLRIRVTIATANFGVTLNQQAAIAKMAKVAVAKRLQD